MENIYEMIGREKIKPSSPTPSHKKIYNLSWFDQISHRSFIPILLFFHKPTNYTISEISNILKTSLSQTLTNYYPFAGTIRDRESILCDDEGVDFLEAKFNTQLSSILENPRRETVDELFPDKLHWMYPETPTTPFLMVQVNYFDCGGLAVAVCLSHKISDTATLVSFLNSWATVARNSGEEYISSSPPPPPPLNAAEIFPCGDLPLFPEPTYHPTEEVTATRRFVFGGEKIAELKRVTCCSSRVDALAALLFKSAVRASEKAGGGASSLVLLQQVNLRARTVPKLPENIVGNMVGSFPVAAPLDGSQLREALTDYSHKYFERYRGDIDEQDWCSAVKKCFEDTKSFMTKNAGQSRFICTSWCRFPIYGIDFGWGEPVWATTAGTVDKNVLIMMDTKCGDGIEAIVTLEEKEMSVFECDEELLQFAYCMS